jgi:hypothetical protein
VSMGSGERERASQLWERELGKERIERVERE